MKNWYRRLRKFRLKVGDDVDFCMKDKVLFTKIIDNDTIEIWSFGERHEEKP